MSNRRTFKIEAKGIGRPDYSKEVASGKIRAGIRLAFNEQLKMFTIMFTNLPSLVPWRQDPLAVGATAHLIDSSTGIPMPYMHPAGYDLEILSWWHSFTENLNGVVIGDGQPTFNNALLTRDTFYLQEVVGWSAKLVDPELLYPHSLDLTALNVGAAACHGSIIVMAILRREKSAALATTKKVRCPYCKAEKTVPLMSTKIKCDKCGKDFLVYAFGWGGKFPTKPK